MTAYTDSAQIYDLLYSFKNYQPEADAIRTLIDSNTTHPTQTVLDVGCGTGAHLGLLKDFYTCEGIDSSEAMLAVAREKLPGMPLHHGDMRTFTLNKQFDVVLCLFSAIGYMTTVEDLQLAVNNMVRHVTPGGLLIVESWLHPDLFRPNHISLLTVERPEIKIARTHITEVVGHITRMAMHYLVTTLEGVTHFVEVHEMGLYPSTVYENAFQLAGLSLTVDATYERWRTLYIGRKPEQAG